MDGVRCPRCSAEMDIEADEIQCRGCGRPYPRLAGIPVLLRSPDAYLESCGRRLSLLVRQAAQTIDAIQEQLNHGDLLSATKDRCRATIQAVQAHADEIRSLLGSLLPTVEPVEQAANTPTPFQHIHYLYRDWGWPADPDGENERALAAMESVIESKPLGRTLVIGAGACRLAYDLHRGGSASDTIVVDIDPLLFVAAQTVIRGDSLTLHEANAEAPEIGEVSKAWRLKAPSGALDSREFHFMIADGREPPFGSVRSFRSSAARRWTASSVSSSRMRRLAAESS